MNSIVCREMTIRAQRVCKAVSSRNKHTYTPYTHTTYTHTIHTHTIHTHTTHTHAHTHDEKAATTFCPEEYSRTLYPPHVPQQQKRLRLPDVDHVRVGVAKTIRRARIPLPGTTRLRDAPRRVTPRITNVCHPPLHMPRAVQRWLSPPFVPESRLYVAAWMSTVRCVNVNRARRGVRDAKFRCALHVDVDVAVQGATNFAGFSAGGCCGGTHRRE